MAGADPDATRSLDLFVAAFGAAAGNVGLTVLATAGVYLAGGIAPRIVAKLREGAFLAAFRSKGRMAGLMARLPVHVVTTPDVGLLGAAAAGGGAPGPGARVHRLRHQRRDLGPGERLLPDGGRHP